MSKKAKSGSFGNLRRLNSMSVGVAGDGPAGTIDPHTHDGSGRFGGLELDLAYSTLVRP
jgi:hypothetical protein